MTTAGAPGVTAEPTWLTHGRVRLALHQLKAGSARSLLVLHGLGESASSTPRSWVDEWAGPVWALDFTGHGRSSVPVGGGYTSEVLMADADTALRHLGGATVLGRGLGAYVALLLAGARPDAVVGAVLADGPGLAGGGPEPQSPTLLPLSPQRSGTPDPFVFVELGADVRPGDYATSFARHAVEQSSLDTPITVTAVVRPPWLAAVAAEPGVAESTVDQALARYRTIKTNQPDSTQ